jgi:hypothetical protein
MEAQVTDRAVRFPADLLLQRGASVAVDFSAEGDFGDRRGFPAHFFSSMEILTGSWWTAAALGRGCDPGNLFIGYEAVYKTLGHWPRNTTKEALWATQHL